jgi:hypothetical protein
MRVDVSRIIESIWQNPELWSRAVLGFITRDNPSISVSWMGDVIVHDGLYGSEGICPYRRQKLPLMWAVIWFMLRYKKPSKDSKEIPRPQRIIDSIEILSKIK